MSQPSNPNNPSNPPNPKDADAKRKELQAALDEAELEWLRPHLARQAVIVVDRSLDIVEVGVRLAIDDVASVQAWLQKGLLAKPSSHQLESWEASPGLRFHALIVQPYVLVQQITFH